MALVRWLLFRMMFASGAVKLTSGCPAWWGLTAMPTHYFSQVTHLLFPGQHAPTSSSAYRPPWPGLQLSSLLGCTS